MSRRPPPPQSQQSRSPYKPRLASTPYPAPPTPSAPSSSSSARPPKRAYIDLSSPPSSPGPPAKRRDNPGPSTQLDYDYADDAGAHDVIDLSQDDDANTEYGEDWEHYGHLLTKVVGVRYYTGIATVGEQVLMVREPGNRYDPNAIRVDNVSHTQIGHIPATLARQLAPLLDSGSLHPEGTVAGRSTTYDMPLTLNLYGSTNPALRAQIKAQIRASKLPLRASAEQQRREQSEAAAAAISELAGPPAPSWDHLVGASEMFNPRDIGSVVQKFGVSEADLAALPSAAQPARLATQMLPYQLQGLAWLLQKEHPTLPVGTDIVQLWKKVPVGWQNIATNYTTRAAPELASGGVLADDMGLGKTLQMIALVVTDPLSEPGLVKSVRPMNGCTGGTLIVCPVSVMSNWTDQIKHHVSESMPLKVTAYHGTGREKIDFGEHDVIVTSYGTLSSELAKKSAKGLHSIKWRRIILDEAHQIRNPKAKSSLAATNLKAASRWCLTGTPIINTLKDLYSLLRFLRFPGGLAEFDIFNRVVIRPLTREYAGASSRLQALMASLCLRRTKEMKFIDLRLPECKEFVHRIPWYPEEREKYNVLNAQAKGLLDRFAANATDQKDQYRFLLEILLRMRQVCNHWSLCGERVESLLKLAGMSKVVLNEENRRALQDLLQIAVDSQEECAVCLEALHEPRITICKHVFGLECIEKVIEIQQKCPLCRCDLPSLSSLVEPPTDAPEPAPIDLSHNSSKIQSLLQILTATRSKDPSSKTVVFSQWTSFLNILEPHLRTAGLTFARIDGNMPIRARDAALHTLAHDPTCTVFLASLAVASVGLNLVAANQVVLADSWWAPAIEDQAIDRVHRLGQRRETTVFRLVMEDSIEERVLAVQEKKRGLVATAFQEGAGRNRGKAKVARLADLQMLIRGPVAAGPAVAAGAGRSGN